MAEDIAQIRSQIDEIDDEIIELFKRRCELAPAIAAYKNAHDLPVMDAGRERAVVASAASQVPDDLKGYTEVLMQLLMEASRSRQNAELRTASPEVQAIKKALESSPTLFPRQARVACQGVEGAYSQIACDRIFKHAQISYYDSFASVFQAVEAGECAYGVLPVENSTAGSVNKVFDLMRAHDFHIVRTCRVKVDHNLLAKPQTTLADVRHIYSHEQAINQCGQFLSTLSGVEVHRFPNTAMAAQAVAESDRDDVAALASRAAAKLYGLRTLAHAVQDQDNNYTRFACITRDLRIYPGADRSSLMLVVSHEPGSLYRVLAKFSALDINIIKLESRPIPERDFEFMFYFDIECPAAAPEFLELMNTIGDVCESFRYLGSYSEVL